jgi:hypothetical protein
MDFVHNPLDSESLVLYLCCSASCWTAGEAPAYGAEGNECLLNPLRMPGNVTNHVQLTSAFRFLYYESDKMVILKTNGTNNS